MGKTTKVETAIGEVEVEDGRFGKRYVMTEALPGKIAGGDVRVVNIGVGGVGITTSAPLKLGNDVTLIVENQEFSERLKFRCEVQWCKTSGEKTETGGLLYRAGMAFTQNIDEIAGPLGRLIRFCGTEDRESFQRKIELAARRHLAKAMSEMTLPATISTDDVLRVERALMAINKGEDVDSLVARAREEIDRRNLTAAESRDVLAIWARLDYSIPLKTISAVRAALESIKG